MPETVPRHRRLMMAPLAAAAFAFFSYWSLTFAIASMWASSTDTSSSLRGEFPALALSLASGLLAIAIARTLMGWQARSWWLLLATPIPSWLALQML